MLIPQKATVANALRPSKDTPMTGAFAPEAFPIAPFRADLEIPLPKSNAEVGPTSTVGTSRSDVLPAGGVVSSKAGASCSRIQSFPADGSEKS